MEHFKSKLIVVANPSTVHTIKVILWRASVRPEYIPETREEGALVDNTMGATFRPPLSHLLETANYLRAARKNTLLNDVCYRSLRDVH